MENIPPQSATPIQRSWIDLRGERSVVAIGKIPIHVVLTVPTAMCVAMLAIGISLSRAADIDVSAIFVPYLATAAAVTTICLLVFIFVEFAKLALRLADRPIPIVIDAVRQRLPFLVLPVVVFPLFLAGFTGAKTAIPHMVGFRWDAFWADLDRLIFRDDAWRITHGVFGRWTMPAWEWVYTVGWGFALAFSKALTALYLPPRRLAVFYSAMMGTWLVGGWLLAYCFSAAGPVFVHLVDPTMADRFAALKTELAASLSSNGAVRQAQTYLVGAINAHGAVKGGGISAMPSMHLGAASIYVLLARGTRWLGPAILFWLLIFIGSAHFGYHYWVDGIVAAGVAWACWAVAEACYEGKVSRQVPVLVQSA